MRIYLIGFMGSGKTSIGKQVAQQLGIPFVDTDAYIVSQQGKSIAAIFAEEGEKGFRQMEHQALLSLSKEVTDAVISTGGGLPCFSHNMDFIQQDGVSFYLDVPVQELQRRLRLEKDHRPLLQNKDDAELLAYIQEALAQRLPFYSQAQHTVPGFDASVTEICKLATK